MNINTLNQIFSECGRIHFIGIGGISMSSLAMIAHDRGYTVTGSDRSSSVLTEKLEAAGIKITYAHLAENVQKADAIVYTAAVKEDNPEMAEAIRLGIPLVRRAEFLGFIMQDYKNRIGVAGMHGKSTTTSMLSQIFMYAVANPTIVNGVELSILDGAYHVGGKEHFIFEACEYTDSFLSFLPTIAVILNIDRDHVDYFLSMEQTIESFRRYMNIAPVAIVNWDDIYVREACRGYKGKLIKVGIASDDVEYKARNISFKRGLGEFDIYREGLYLGHIILGVPGEHSIYDALISASAADISGISFKAIAKGLLEYSGAHRRFERIGSFNDGIEVYDDYAHHPSEIKITLDGISKRGFNETWCIFQPHTYSRTAILFEDFLKAFDSADHVIFADIYAARETNTYGVSSEALAKALGEKAIYLPTFEEISDYIRQNAKKGDLVLTMGAGDVYKIGYMLTGKK